jgi:NAD+ synthetase
MTALKPLRIAAAQLNATVGAVAANLDAAVKARAVMAGRADLVVFPECFISGYPAEDLWLRPAFIESVHAAVLRLAETQQPGEPGVLIGAPWRGEDGKLYNAALLLDGGKISGVTYKHQLPNYSVFDERRYFTPGELPAPLNFRGHSLGVQICEDLWYPGGAAALKVAGAGVLITLNASPYEQGKQAQRLSAARQRVAETGLPLVYVNLVGGQDDVVFDGGSFALDARGVQTFTAGHCVESIELVSEEKQPFAETARLAEIYTVLTLGLRDYARKNGFSSALLGLSGGIDSALVLALAVDALGAENVRTVMLSTEFTSAMSRTDAAALAAALGSKHEDIVITPGIAALEGMLAPAFKSAQRDTTEENLQARLRGVLLMALANKQGSLLLTTGNKSEYATGYTTLYGDMCGGYAPLKDVYKTLVFQLAYYRGITPQRIITRAPSAELKDAQRDEDSLPPYPVLDGILRGLIEREESAETLIAAGYPAEMVARTARLLKISEFKRRQSAPGCKITSKALGRERRFPVTMGEC